MRGRQLERALIAMSGLTPADIDIRFRALRESGDIPAGPRGVHAPQLGAENIARVLIGIGGASKAVDAAKAVETFAPMVPPRAPDAPTLLQVLTEAINDPDKAWEIWEVRFCRSWSRWAEIIRRDGSSLRYFATDCGIDWNTFDPDKQGSASGREEYAMGGGMLHQLAIDLDENDHEAEF